MKILSLPLGVLAVIMTMIFVVDAGAQGQKSAKNEKICTVECQKEKALNGDPLAARNLALVYGKIDFKAMQYWNLIGAENGDGVSQYNYAFWLLEKGLPENRSRAVFWLKKAAESGDRDAKKLLRETNRR